MRHPRHHVVEHHEVVVGVVPGGLDTTGDQGLHHPRRPVDLLQVRTQVERPAERVIGLDVELVGRLTDETGVGADPRHSEPGGLICDPLVVATGLGVEDVEIGADPIAVAAPADRLVGAVFVEGEE